MKRDAIDLSTLNVFTLFRKYFVFNIQRFLDKVLCTGFNCIL